MVFLGVDQRRGLDVRRLFIARFAPGVLMNIYDHEYAFKEANLCAGRRTKLADALGTAMDQHTARLIIQDCQDKYTNVFEAFIEGVAYARELAKIDDQKKVKP